MAGLSTEIQGLWVSKNMNAPTPNWSLVSTYPFRQPERVYFNPYNNNEMWVSGFGNGMKKGLLSGTIDINQFSVTKQSLSSFPNPFNNKLYISNPSKIVISKVNINNSEGKLVYSEDYPGNYILTENIPSGVYILEIITIDHKRIIEKIVK